LNVQADKWLSRHPDELADVNHGIKRAEGRGQRALNPGPGGPGLSTVPEKITSSSIDTFIVMRIHQWEFLGTSRMVAADFEILAQMAVVAGIIPRRRRLEHMVGSNDKMWTQTPIHVSLVHFR
jgi:hypothetical protein